MVQETYDWSTDYTDEDAGTLTTFTSATGETVDISVSQPDPNGWYRNNRDGFETNSTMGGSSSGYFEKGVNFDTTSDTVTTSILFSNNTESGENSVTDVSFTLFDIDSTTNATFQDQVTVLAFDADGNALTVTLTPVDPTVVTVVGGTVTAIPGAGSGPSGSVAANSTEGNVDVSIAGEVAEIRIIYGNGPLAQTNPSNQAIGFGDLSFDLVPTMICFVRGTRIRTMNGHPPVEELKVGDLVMTVDHGLQPIRWIGRRTVSGLKSLAPVRFDAGTVGNARPLLLSPHHRVLVSDYKASLITGHDEVLAAAKDLVNGRGIIGAPRHRVDYFHILLDTHEIVYAEGAMCESLFAGPQALRSMAHGDIVQLFPDTFGTGGMPMDLARPCLRSYENVFFR